MTDKQQETEFDIEEFLRQIDAYKDRNRIDYDSDIATICDLDKSVIAKLRAGDRKPSVSTFKKICKALNFDANEF